MKSESVQMIKTFLLLLVIFISGIGLIYICFYGMPFQQISSGGGGGYYDLTDLYAIPFLVLYTLAFMVFQFIIIWRRKGQKTKTKPYKYLFIITVATLIVLLYSFVKILS